MKKIILLLLFTTFAYSQTYNLSTSFGTNGIVQTENTTTPLNTIITPNDEILSVGNIYIGGINLIFHSVLVKYDSTGNLDVSFGNDGIVQTEIDYNDTAYTVAIQTDGKILIAGDYTLQSPPNGVYPRSPFIARYENDGTLDNTFGNNGILKITSYNQITPANVCKIEVLNNNKILLGISGSANNLYGSLCMLNSDGSFDLTFGNNGILNLGDSSFKFFLTDFKLLLDNTLLLTGADKYLTSNIKSAVIKLNLDGSYVNAFADNGKLIIDFFTSSSSSSYEYFYKIHTSNDGNFFASGYSTNTLPHTLIKFSLNGELINSFANNGVLLHSFSYNDVSVQGDNKIIIGGTNSINNNSAFRLTRLNQNGSLDTSFNSTGFFDLDINSYDEGLLNVLVDNTNSIIICGNSKLNDNYVFTFAKIEPENLKNNDFNFKPSVYPNPIIDCINFSENVDLKLVQIFDMSGKLIVEYKDIGVVNFLKVALNKGFYICKIINVDGDQKNFKLIKS